MNIPNLLKMAEYIATVPQEMFDMEQYRDEFDERYPKCNTVGCVIGHCTVLDRLENIPTFNNKICFVQWSQEFTGINVSSEEWDWCFSWKWAQSDNTPTGASKRIKYLIEHGLPENWKEQMNGEAELIYK
jgi:hypothetical protein